MMRRAVLVCGLCLWAVAASAQVGEFSLSLGQSSFRNNSLGSAGDGSVYKVGDGFRLGLRFTLNTYRFFGHEFGYAYSRSKLQVQSDSVGLPVHQGFYNFLAYALPEGSAFRPFATGGVHFSTFYPPGTSVSYGNGVTKFGVNYGGGLKMRITPIFALRADIRDYITGKPFDLPNRSGKLHQLELSGGLAFIF